MKDPKFRELPLTGPRVIGTNPPTDSKERERILFTSVLSGADLHVFPQYHVPYEQVAVEVAAKGLTVEKAREVQPEAAAAVAEYAARTGRSAADLRYLPMRARRAWLAAVVDANSGAVIVILPVKPRSQ